MNRSEIARKIVKECGIELTEKQKQYVIAYPFSPDVFPVAIGDDGGIVFYECEVPITREGDLIQVGHRYDTTDEDNMLVKSMELKRYTASFRWYITVVDSDDYEWPMLVWEFKRISF